MAEWLNLVEKDSELLDWSEFLEEKYLRKIPIANYSEYISKARTIGTERGLQVEQQHLEKELLKVGYTVELVTTKSTNPALTMRAQTIRSNRERKVIIFRHSLEEMMRVNAHFDLGLDEARIYSMHLAHELFHVQEELLGDVGELLPSVERFSFLGKSYRGQITAGSEIASHAFCRKVLHWDKHPKLIDFLVLAETQQMTAEDLLNYFQKISQIREESKNGSSKIIV